MGDFFPLPAVQTDLGLLFGTLAVSLTAGFYRLITDKIVTDRSQRLTEYLISAPFLSIFLSGLLVIIFAIGEPAVQIILYAAILVVVPWAWHFRDLYLPQFTPVYFFGVAVIVSVRLALLSQAVIPLAILMVAITFIIVQGGYGKPMDRYRLMMLYECFIGFILIWPAVEIISQTVSGVRPESSPMWLLLIFGYMLPQPLMAAAYVFRSIPGKYESISDFRERVEDELRQLIAKRYISYPVTKRGVILTGAAAAGGFLLTLFRSGSEAGAIAVAYLCLSVVDGYVRRTGREQKTISILHLLLTREDGNLFLLTTRSGNHALPGGLVRDQETLEQAVAREAFSDTCLSVSDIRIIDRKREDDLDPATRDFEHILVSARAYGTVHLAPEFDHFDWVKPDTLKEKLGSSLMAQYFRNSILS